MGQWVIGASARAWRCSRAASSWNAPSATPNKAAASARPVNVGTFVDARGEPANWLGAIRGGFGNPLKNLESDRPVADIVGAAFADGLRARGVTVDPEA